MGPLQHNTSGVHALRCLSLDRILVCLAWMRARCARERLSLQAWLPLLALFFDYHHSLIFAAPAATHGLLCCAGAEPARLHARICWVLAAPVVTDRCD